MTRNFKILTDYNVVSDAIANEKIKNKINEIEGFVRRKENLRYPYIEAAKILEIIVEEYKLKNGLYNAIKNIIDLLGVPTRVRNALYSIRKKRNEEAHINKSDIPFRNKVDLYSIIELLKNLYITIKYFVKEHNKNFSNNIDEYRFNSDIYFEKPIVENENNDNLKDTYRIETKLETIFNLIFSNVDFLIPTYQRDYNWNISSIETFLEDIKNRASDNETHYLGSIALGSNQDEKVLNVIDGQQRITTSLLLIRAIINNFKENKLKLPEELAIIDDKLASKYKNSTASYSRLEHIKKILNNQFNIVDKDFKKSNAYINFDYIKKELSQMTQNTFLEFYTSFYSNFLISRVTFKIEPTNEIQVFENLNSKGTKLSEWDLIKNYIYKNVSLDFLLKYETQIEQLINRLFILKAFQHFERAKEKKLSNFFVLYCRIENKIRNGEILVKKSKIFRTFSSLWPVNMNRKFNDIEELENALKKPARMFHIYCLLESREYLKNDSSLAPLKLHLENLSVKDTHYPLVINAILENARWNDIEIEKIPEQNMQKLITFIGDIDKYVTRLIVVQNIGQSLGNFFDGFLSSSIFEMHKRFLEGINKRGKQISLPSLNQFVEEIKTKGDWQEAYAKSYLRTIAWSDANFNRKAYDIWQNPALEHIFPENANSQSNWFKNSQISWDEFEEKLNNNVNKIGNYLVILNNKKSQIKNKTFLEKRDVYHLCADEVLLSGEVGNIQIMNLRQKLIFTFNDIEKRTKELASLATKFYRLSSEKQ